MNKKFVLSLIFVFYSLLLGATTAKAQVVNPKPIVSHVINIYMQRHNVPGVAVGLYMNGKSYVYNFGVANRDSGQPVTNNTLFEIGSVTKLFTMTLAALAIQQGKLSLNDKAVTFLPKWVSNQDGSINQVTIEELATHSSSLPRTPPNIQLIRTNGMIRPDYNENKLLHFVANWQAAYPVGSHYRYSNIAYGILADVVANIYNQSYAQLLQNKIFTPLAMTNSFLHVPGQDMANYATGYRATGNPAPRYFPTGWVGAGGIKSTSADMLKFIKAYLDAPGTPSDLANATQFVIKQRFFNIADKALPGAKVGLNDVTQGLGWSFKPFRGQTIAMKNGETAGFSALVVLVPAKKMGIVVLVNKKRGLNLRPTQAILRRLFKAQA